MKAFISDHHGVVTTKVDLTKIINNEWELLMRALTARRKIMFGTWKILLPMLQRLENVWECTCK